VRGIHIQIIIKYWLHDYHNAILARAYVTKLEYIDCMNALNSIVGCSIWLTKTSTWCICRVL